MTLLSKEITVTDLLVFMKGLKMDYSKVLSNSIRLRIWAYVLNAEQATTKDIAEHMPDVPVPTLYRHINFLIEQEAIIVKEERKVRGSRERILTGNMDFFKKATMYEYFSPYLMNLNERFYKYGKSVSCMDTLEKLESDLLCFYTKLLMLTDEDMQKYLDELWELSEKYRKISDQKKKKAKFREVTIISAPTEMHLRDQFEL